MLLHKITHNQTSQNQNIENEWKATWNSLCQAKPNQNQCSSSEEWNRICEPCPSRTPKSGSRMLCRGRGTEFHSRNTPSNAWRNEELKCCRKCKWISKTTKNYEQSIKRYQEASKAVLEFIWEKVIESCLSGTRSEAGKVAKLTEHWFCLYRQVANPQPKHFWPMQIKQTSSVAKCTSKLMRKKAS